MYATCVYLFFEVTISETEVYNLDSCLFFEVTIPETEAYDVENGKLPACAGRKIT
jgi:hypothetical protein